MTEFHKKKKFINTPKYPGGSEAFKAFMAQNLTYPKMAIENRIEGSVIVGFDIQDTGQVLNARIIKGLGYGCDEEALRLVSILQFEKVKNRGLRVKMSTKTTIHFRLPAGLQINYSVVAEEKPPETTGQKPDSGQVTYEYTITF